MQTGTNPSLHLAFGNFLRVILVEEKQKIRKTSSHDYAATHFSNKQLEVHVENLASRSLVADNFFNFFLSNFRLSCLAGPLGTLMWMFS